MPLEAELPDNRPHRVWRSAKLDGFRKALHLRVWHREIRKGRHAALSRLGRPAQEELAVAVDQPGKQDVDHIRVDRAAAAGLVGTAGDRTLFDLEMTLV